MKKQNTARELPGLEEIVAERRRLKHHSRWARALGSTVSALLVVAAVAVLVATSFLPVFQVSGASMEPNFHEGDILVGVRPGQLDYGQVCGFYVGNKLLLKRVVALAGDNVSIDSDGNVTVNGELIEETYLADRAEGIHDLTYPYQVPDGCVFLLGDDRADSVDSRSASVGPVAIDDVAARIVFRVWPLNAWGLIG